MITELAIIFMLSAGASSDATNVFELRNKKIIHFLSSNNVEEELVGEILKLKWDKVNIGDCVGPGESLITLESSDVLLSIKKNSDNELCEENTIFYCEDNILYLSVSNNSVFVNNLFFNGDRANKKDACVVSVNGDIYYSTEFSKSSILTKKYRGKYIHRYGIAPPSMIPCSEDDDHIYPVDDPCWGTADNILIGIVSHEITDKVMRKLNLSRNYGIYIGGLYVNYPAEKYGLKYKDIIDSMNGKKILNSNDMDDIVRSLTEEDVLKITVIRGNDTISMDMPLSK